MMTEKIAVLVIATAAAFLTPFIGSSVNIALPAIGTDFAMSGVELSWVGTAFLLSSAIFLVPMGKIGDIYGRKKIFTTGIIIFTVSNILSAFAMSGIFLIGMRALQGFGSAMIFGTSIAMVTSVYPPQERGRAIGVTVSSVYIGLSAGPFIGGILTERFGWHSIFLVTATIGVVLTLFIITRVKHEWADARGEKLDIPGSIIYAVSLPSLIFGFSNVTTTHGLALTIAGIAGLAIFIKWEFAAKNPVINMNLFAENKLFAFSNLAALINYSATFSVAFLLSLYLQYLKGLSPQEAGIVILAQPVIMAIFSPVAGRLSDKIEPKILSTAGMTISAAGTIPFVFIDSSTHIGLITACLIFLGFGFALFSSPNTNAIMGSVDRKYLGVASATVGTMRLTGQMLSMGIATIVFANYIGNEQISSKNIDELLKGINFAFMISALLSTIGIIPSVYRGKKS